MTHESRCGETEQPQYWQCATSGVIWFNGLPELGDCERSVSSMAKGDIVCSMTEGGENDDEDVNEF